MSGPTDDIEPGASPTGRAGSFFGRRRGKPLRKGQAATIAGGLPAHALPEGPIDAPLAALFAAPVERVEMEIGFGGGEHMIARLAADPGLGTIGVEPFLNGMAKALAGIEAAGLGARVRLHGEDAAPLLDRLPAASLDRLHLLYPDPWPKSRHHKRRFVSPENLDRIARVLKPGAEFRFASDWPDYVAWTLRHVLADRRFRWTARVSADWTTPYPGWPGTRYEEKAAAEGRAGCYLGFVRV